MGNQSLCMAIAEGLKARRMMEASLAFPNSHPSGADGYAYKFQFGAEELFRRLATSQKHTDYGYRSELPTHARGDGLGFGLRR